MNKQALMIALVMLTLGAGGGYWYARTVSSSAVSTPAAQLAAERQPLFYRHPMTPGITSPVPAKDAMNMDYIPVYAEDDSGPAGTVKIDPVTVQNIGVRSARAERRVIGHTLRAVGRVDYNEERLTRLNPKTEGWVEKLMVSNTGQQVKRGDALLSLYSPQLVTAQQEYLLALQNRAVLEASPYAELRGNAAQLAEASRGRLALLDMPIEQIHDLERGGKVMKAVQIRSPFDGVVVSVGARPGEYVMPASELYQIADLSRLWVYVDVYENELPWVAVGDAAQMRIKAAPGRVFAGKVTYLYPSVDPQTRTARLRLEFANADGVLKPEMFAEVTLRGGKRIETVAVPSEAIVRSGTRERVFVVRAPGKFEPREVSLGVSADGWTEIKKGLSAGEDVVTSAQFLIDAESTLREAGGKMREQTNNAPEAGLDMSDLEMTSAEITDMDMSDMDMSDMDMSDMGMKIHGPHPAAPGAQQHD